MAPSTSSLFLIFLLHLPLLALAQFSSCPTSFNCQNFSSLQFPLSNNVQPDCGLFMLNCTASPYPLIQLHAGGPWYEILKKISSNKFFIRDRVLQNHLVSRSCSSLFDSALPKNPSTTLTISPNLTVFICSGEAQGEDTSDFLTQKCPGSTAYYRSPASTSTGNETTVPYNCRKLQLPRNPSEHNSSDLFSLLTAEFTVEWNISADCLSCHSRGGQCDRNYKNEFLCLPPEQNLRQESESENQYPAGVLELGALDAEIQYPGLASTSGTMSLTTARIMVGVAVLFLVMLAAFIVWWQGRCSCSTRNLTAGLRQVNLQTSCFTYQQIQTATNNFSPANKIGEGGFGPVYKGTLSDGTAVAVKQLSSKSRQGNREFITEIGIISALQHPNLVKLYGCCVEGNNLLLIYEYMRNNSLARALFCSEDYKLNLDWPTRHKICVGVARGLAFLHQESALKIVHRDIKSANVLLDGNLVPKIADFGLARLHEEDDTHISTRIAGTLGYMAPEYAMEGYLTDKADVYSFGVVLLEIVSGRTNNPKPGEEFNLLGQANYLSKNHNLMELVDSRLESNCYKEEILVTINIALICTNSSGDKRPSMSTVVNMLTGSSQILISA